MVGSYVSDNRTWTLSNNETTLALVSATGLDPIAPTVVTLNSTALVLLFPKGSYNYLHTDGSSDVTPFSRKRLGSSRGLIALKGIARGNNTFYVIVSTAAYL